MHADFRRLVVDLPASLTRLGNRVCLLPELKTFGIIIAVDPNEPVAIRLAFFSCVAVPPSDYSPPDAPGAAPAAPTVAVAASAVEDSDSFEVLLDDTNDEDYEDFPVGSKRVCLLRNQF